MKDISPKVAASGLTGAVLVLLVYLASLVSVDVPVAVQAALLVILPVVAGFLKSDALRNIGKHVKEDAEK